MQLCTLYFGQAPYNNVAITEQPNFNFGQSWPSLVYLPISAYIDSTQRWQLFGTIDSNFTGFVQEVTPHEVAHQWFGHSVSWPLIMTSGSRKDLPISPQAFSGRSTGRNGKKTIWNTGTGKSGASWRRTPTDCLERRGPLWLGLRLVSPKTRQAYQGVTYSKGAYVLLMLKSMMYDDQHTGGNPNQNFIDMMHDFISSHQNTPASTESFKAIAEKHMPKQIDLQSNGNSTGFSMNGIWNAGTSLPVEIRC